MRFDRSSCTVLAVCDRCEWLELVLDLDDAHAAALDHLWRVHPDDALTIHAVHERRRRSRHADPF